MAPEGMQAARCVRCNLTIVASGGLEALKKMGWVEVEGAPDAKEKQPAVRPMICPKCAGMEGDPPKGLPRKPSAPDRP